MTSAITANPVARVFFLYLLLLLAAILGQDVLLEPFGAEAFGMTVTQTTRITSLWGTFVLLAIIAAGLLEGRVSKRLVAQLGNSGALLGFIVIVLSGILINKTVFYTGVTLLGIGTGLSTVSNLSLMFDLTIPGMIGLYIGAWGFSNAPLASNRFYSRWSCARCGDSGNGQRIERVSRRVRYRSVNVAHRDNYALSNRCHRVSEKGGRTILCGKSRSCCRVR